MLLEGEPAKLRRVLFMSKSPQSYAPWGGTSPSCQPSVSRALILDLVSSCPHHPLEFSRNEGKVCSSKRMWFQSREGCRQLWGAVALRRSRCEYPGRPGAGQAHGNTPCLQPPSLTLMAVSSGPSFSCYRDFCR